jgi:dTDP-4-amino-4,6-dideoxygalactose transaminase
MKPVFNSLGSNYSWQFIGLAFQQLWFLRPITLEQVQRLLESKYHGRAYLFYKGRDAIEFSLRSFGIGQGAQVLTQAFTCYAIEEAIERAGAEPIFADLAQNKLNPSVATLQAAYKKAPKAKAVLIQHTLGYPAEIQKIAQWCHKNKLLLIEDLAQSLGAQDSDGTELGTYGDVVICSFGRDKIIDAVSGGAVILKTNSPFFEKAQDEKIFAESVKLIVPKKIIRKDMFYPLLTGIIRSTHRIVIGKILFQITKRMGLLTSPISSPTEAMAALPAEYAPLILWQFQRLHEQLQHRKEIAEIYDQILSQFLDVPVETSTALKKNEQLEQPSYLRFALHVPKPLELADELLAKKLYLTDRWYRQAVDCGSLELQSKYKPGSCPEAEERASHIFNLPTHRSINKNTAQRIMLATIEALQKQS